MMNKLANDIATAVMYKLAALAEEMEKLATPKPEVYARAVSNRMARGKALANNLKAFKNFDMPGSKLSLQGGTDFPSIGARGNNALNTMTQGVYNAPIGKQTKRVLAQEDLLNRNVTDAQIDQGIQRLARPDTKYMQRLTGITNQNILNRMIDHPEMLTV